MNEQRNLEKEETQIYMLFQKKIKRWSWFVLIVCSYMLLNVFIGFSSAPFYRKVETCSRFDPTPECKQIMNRTEEMYFVEAFSGLYALYQGMLGVILADKIQDKRIVILLNKSSKFALLFYPVMFIIRMIIYVLLY